MDIGVVGGGGIGSYYAAVLTRAGQRVLLFTRGEHLAAVQAKGIEVRTPAGSWTGRPEAVSGDTDLARCDYVIVAVKGYSLPDVAPVLARAARAGSVIVPLLNGIDVAERLERDGVPRAAIAGGLATVSLARPAPGLLERRSVFDRIVVGELHPGSPDRLRPLVDALTGAGVEARLSEDIQHDLWWKFAFIVPMTVACGLARSPAGPVLATEAGRWLITGSLNEIVAVSLLAGGTLGQNDHDRVAHDLFALPAAMRPSFLADLERGGPTEVDLLAGTVSRLGAAHGVPTPIHDVAAAAFRAAAPGA